MNEVVDIVSNLRDLVDEYTRIINIVKLYIYQASSSDSEIDVLINRLSNIVEYTRNVFTLFKRNVNALEDRYRVYAETYYEYISLISIPYLIDLLGKLREHISSGKIERINNIVNDMKTLLEI